MNIDNEEISIAQRITVIDGAAGLIGNKTAYVKVDRDEALYALDFHNYMGSCLVISAVNEPEIIEGTAGGLTFDRGRKNSLAKLRIAATVADEYVVGVTAYIAGKPRYAEFVVKAT
jgi:hypothetical protein